MLSLLGLSVLSILTRSWALQVSKGSLSFRTMYVFLPVLFFKSFECSLAENMAILNVIFLANSPSISFLGFSATQQLNTGAHRCCANTDFQVAWPSPFLFSWSFW